MRPRSLPGGMGMEWLAAVSIIVTNAVSIVYAVIAYKNSKKTNDPVWDAALKLTISSGGQIDPDTFAQNYEELQAFKANGCTLGDCFTCVELIKKKASSADTQTETHCNNIG